MLVEPYPTGHGAFTRCAGVPTAGILVRRSNRTGKGAGMATIELRGTNLYYEVAGNGNVPLLFIHGMCGGAWVWADQAARLSDRFTCVTYDRRGHSRSTDGAGDQSVPTHAEDAAALIAALGLERPVVVASSGGAVVAVELLHRRQDLVRGAVLSEPPLFSIDPVAADQLKAEIGEALGSIPANAGSGALLEAFFGVVCPGLWPRLDEGRRANYRENAGLLLPTLEAVPISVTIEDLTRIEVPVLAIAGARSHPVAVSITRRMADSLPGGRLVMLEEAGHATYVEQPAAFEREVAAFAAEQAAVDAVPGAFAGQRRRSAVDA